MTPTPPNTPGPPTPPPAPPGAQQKTTRARAKGAGSTARRATPTAPGKTATVDEIMEAATQALHDTRYWECEAMCLRALEKAYTSQDYERMARIVMPLQETRRQQRQLAEDAAGATGVRVIEERPTGTGEAPGLTEPGCYLLRPPLVGADGRELRDRADRDAIPVFLLVREPTTRAGTCPVVMIGPVTVRTQVDPPEDPDAPTLDWFVTAHEALGDAAIASVPRDAGEEQRVTHFYERLATITEHEKLHQAFEQACLDAAKAASGGA